MVRIRKLIFIFFINGLLLGQSDLITFPEHISSQNYKSCTNNIKLDVRNFVSGLYFIKLPTRTVTATKKFIKS